MSEAFNISSALGGKPMLDGYLCRCPVPDHGQGHGDRTPSLLIKDGDSRLLVKCFAGCDASAVLDALRRRHLLGDSGRASDRASAQIAPKHASAPHEPDPAAMEIWQAAQPSGDIVRAYLRNRGITTDVPASLREGKIQHLGRYEMPAMVAGAQRPDGKLVAIQQTILSPTARKAAVSTPRLTCGALGAGAVRLARATHELGLAEGIETALSAQQLTGVPCWASLGGLRMPRVAIPDAVTELHLFADNDEPGKAAIERAASCHRDRKVILRFPPERFKDWNDLLAAQGSAAA